jgi:hypothetical protein
MKQCRSSLFCGDVTVSKKGYETLFRLQHLRLFIKLQYTVYTQLSLIFFYNTLYDDMFQSLTLHHQVTYIILSQEYAIAMPCL